MSRRYSYIRKKINKENKNRVYVSTLYPDIEARNSDTVIMVKEGNQRMDLLAYKYYGSPTLWWIISQANNLAGDTMYVPVGTKIRIPTHIDDILRAMDDLNNRR
tara:strand:- start:201 stop:512 length:312 start_codon:yes stop_codon:yes gene_type:complete